MTQKLLATAPIVLSAGIFAAIAGAANPPLTRAGAFLQKNCAARRSLSSPAARLDLTKLNCEPANPDHLATWVKVHDRSPRAKCLRLDCRDRPPNRRTNSSTRRTSTSFSGAAFPGQPGTNAHQNFGVINGAQTVKRQMQIGLKYSSYSKENQ